MNKILSYPLSIIFYLLYGLTLLVMHVAQWLCYNLGGYQAHHKSVKIMNGLLVFWTKILGTTYHYSGRENLIKNVPLIFVSNHQSMYDISPLEYDLADYHPKFISKIELGKGIPSVSYNLRKGGSALIDRKNGKQAIEEIKKLAQYIQKNNYSAIIFPEGTRSKDGTPKAFKENGLKVLTKYAKDAYIVPVTLNNTWELTKYGKFPLNVGTKVTIQYHQPIKVSEYKFEELFELTEKTVKSSITA
ncbi:lysophospholipid acyltransferase family protein [Empedobacter brevis]|uniref:lysophospholipid acyltransferase family protein n=1 Tax=Empedobacter brevis TaxID=247 RepID=UPI0028ACA9FC|nr:lysophospholipid acyltransferase family protein [Empedobacter brevis]